MSVSKTWPGGGANTTPASYSLPLAGELNWTSLPAFLQALGDSAQCTTFQKWAVRKATTTPVTVVATSDCVVVVDLASAGASAVNLPAGANKQVYVIIDGKGDAATNNITVNRNGTDTIKGATTLVVANNRAATILIYNAADTDWKVIGPIIISGTISLTSDVTGTLPIANGGTNATALAAGAAYSTGAALTTESQLAITRGGTNASSLASGAAYSTGTALTTEAQLAITRGGTNASSLAAGAAYSTGTALTTEAQLAVTRGGTGQSTAIAAFDALNPTTTKGDVVAHDGSTSVRLAVGANGTVLTADSAQASGLAWGSSATVPAAGTVYSNGSALQSVTFTANGNKVYGVNAGATALEVKELSITAAGACTFGPASTTNSHTFNTGAASRTVKIAEGFGSIRPGIVADNAGASIATSLSASDGVGVIAYGGADLYFINNTYANVASVTNLGQSGGTTVGKVFATGSWEQGTNSTSGSRIGHTVNIAGADSGSANFAVNVNTAVATNGLAAGFRVNSGGSFKAFIGVLKAAGSSTAVGCIQWVNGGGGTANYYWTDTNGFLRYSATESDVGSATLGSAHAKNYLEGTFTPTFSFAGGNGTAAIVDQTGKYTRIGNMVLFSFRLNFTKGTASGAFSIAGLPITASTGQPGGAKLDDFTSLGATTVGEISLHIGSGASTMIVYKYSAGATASLNAADMGTQPVLIGHGQYFV